MFRALIWLCSLLASAGAATAGDWDELSREVLPRVIDGHGDLGSIVRELRKATCRVDSTLIASSLSQPVRSSFRYSWEDKDNDETLTSDELEVRILGESTPFGRAADEELRAVLKEWTLTSLFLLIRSHRAKTKRRESGYDVRLTREGSQTEVRLLVNEEYQVDRMVWVDDGTETRTSFRYSLIEGKRYPIRETSEETASNGLGTKADTRIEYSVRNGVPLVKRMSTRLTLRTIGGSVSVEQSTSFSDWKIEMRPETGARQLARSILDKLEKQYFAWEVAYPGVRYVARFLLKDDAGRLMTPVTVEGADFTPKNRGMETDDWCERASRSMEQFRRRIIYSATTAERRTYTAETRGIDVLLMAHEDGKIVERTTLSKGCTMIRTEEWLYTGDTCRFRYCHEYRAQSRDGIHFVLSVTSNVFAAGSDTPIGRTRATFTYTQVHQRIFLERIRLQNDGETAVFELADVKFTERERRKAPPKKKEEPKPGDPFLGVELLQDIAKTYYTWAAHGTGKAYATYDVKDANGKKVAAIQAMPRFIGVSSAEPLPAAYLSVGNAAVEGMKWFFFSPLHSLYREKTPAHTGDIGFETFTLLAHEGGKLVDWILMHEDLAFEVRQEWRKGQDRYPIYRYAVIERGGYLLFDRVEVGICPMGSEKPLFVYSFKFHYEKRHGVTFMTRLEVASGEKKISVELVKLKIE